MLKKITQSEARAEDVIQETFIRIWLYRDKLAGIHNLKSWVFTVAARKSMRYMRQRLTYEKKTAALQDHQLQATDHSPLDFAQLNELNRIVNKVVDAMPSQRKRIYQMSWEQDFKPAAIAAQFSLSVSTVKNVSSLARKEIRDELLKASIALSVILFHFFYFF